MDAYVWPLSHNVTRTAVQAGRRRHETLKYQGLRRKQLLYSKYKLNLSTGSPRSLRCCSCFFVDREKTRSPPIGPICLLWGPREDKARTSVTAVAVYFLGKQRSHAMSICKIKEPDFCREEESCWACGGERPLCVIVLQIGVHATGLDLPPNLSADTLTLGPSTASFLPFCSSYRS